MRNLIRLGFGLVAVLLASCASPTPADTTAQKKKTNDEEYVYQSSLGSRIPRKVKKSQAASSEELTEQSQQALRDAQARGTSTPGGD